MRVLRDSLVILAFVFAAAWPVMLLLGVAHSSDEVVPDLGYDTCIMLLLAARWVGFVAKLDLEDR